MTADPRAGRALLRLPYGPLHLRWQGEGPALVLLHQAPQNGRMWLPLMEELGRRWLCIAPDLPGFDFSAPLPAPSIRGFAEAVLAALHRLGLQRFAVFGMHTGGLVAAEMARLAPERVASVFIDGYAWFEEGERAAFGERYLPPLVPSWDGAHLAWLWARMREQRFFFPWYDGRVEAALALPPPSAEENDALVRDVLHAGDAYRAAYRAALSDGERERILALGVPTTLFYRSDDPLAAHQRRLPPLPPAVELRTVADRRALHEALAEKLAALAPRLPPARIRFLPARSEACACLDTPAGSLACRWQGEGRAYILWLPCPLEGCPPPPAEAAVVCLDWPGQGASEASIELSREQLLQALAAVEAILPLAGIRAFGAAAPLAVEAARLLALPPPELVRPWWLHPEERKRLLDRLPDPRPQRGGGHLLEAWHWARDSFLFPPWSAARGADRLAVAAPAPEAVHERFLRVFLPGAGWPALLSACLEPPATSSAACVLAEHRALVGRGPEAMRG
jgi:pimeloyl-ACP methyl ester carboxylesterase